MSNLIDRQKLAEMWAGFVLGAVLDKAPKAYIDGLTDAYNLICQLPSAQPEPPKQLTDKEFLQFCGKEN